MIIGGVFMKTTIHSTSSLVVTKGMRNYIDDALKQLTYIIPEDSTISCTCKVTKDLKGFELMVTNKEYRVRAETYCNDFYDAVDKSISKAVSSVRKSHKRLLDMKKREKKKGEMMGEMEEVSEEVQLLREKEICAVAMSTESALHQLEVLDHDFFLYLNSETLTPCVVYKRNDGGYGKLSLRTIESPSHTF